MAQSRNARLITKRTSVPGKIPTGTTGDEVNLIKSGELASNLADHNLWGYDGTNVFEYGSKSFFGLTGGTITGDVGVVGNISASTFFSGSTDIEIIIRNLISSNYVSTIGVQPGLNINTGGTSSLPIINLNDNINIVSLSADTFYSGSTEISQVLENQIDTALSALTSSYFDAYDSSGGTTTTTNAWSAKVPLNSQRQLGNDFTHSTIVNNDEVTIVSKSKYLVIGRTSTIVSLNSSVTRSQAQSRLEIDTGSGFSPVEGTTTEMYLRFLNHGASGSFQAVLDLEVGDKLRVTFRRNYGFDQVTLQPGGSSLSIMKVLNGQKGDKGIAGDLSLNSFDDFYVSGTTYSNVFSGNTQEAVFYGDGSNLTGLEIGDIHYMIWAEENGTLSNNNRQWSFGNGGSGQNNVYIMYD